MSGMYLTPKTPRERIQKISGMLNGLAVAVIVIVGERGIRDLPYVYSGTILSLFFVIALIYRRGLEKKHGFRQ